jgi:hypothetical protein
MQASFRSLLKLVEVSPIPGKKVLYAREKVKERLLWLARPGSCQGRLFPLKYRFSLPLFWLNAAGHPDN